MAAKANIRSHAEEMAEQTKIGHLAYLEKVINGSVTPSISNTNDVERIARIERKLKWYSQESACVTVTMLIDGGIDRQKFIQNQTLIYKDIYKTYHIDTSHINITLEKRGNLAFFAQKQGGSFPYVYRRRYFIYDGNTQEITYYTENPGTTDAVKKGTIQVANVDMQQKGDQKHYEITDKSSRIFHLKDVEIQTGPFEAYSEYRKEDILFPYFVRPKHNVTISVICNADDWHKTKEACKNIAMSLNTVLNEYEVINAKKAKVSVEGYTVDLKDQSKTIRTLENEYIRRTIDDLETQSDIQRQVDVSSETDPSQLLQRLVALEEAILDNESLSQVRTLLGTPTIENAFAFTRIHVLENIVKDLIQRICFLEDNILAGDQLKEAKQDNKCLKKRIATCERALCRWNNIKGGTICTRVTNLEIDITGAE